MTPSTRTDFDDRVLACAPGSFPWDLWQQEALSAGLNADLATLGRAVMREAYQHDWCDGLKYECGIDNPDTAAGMITCAKEQPFLVETRWQWLLATDGLRFDPWNREEWPEAAPEWNEMLRRWLAELNTETPRSSENQLLLEAIDYITFFYRLNQLAIVDLEGQAFRAGASETTLWASFTVIDSTQPEPRRVNHSGAIRIDLGKDGDATIFERVEES
jgi:hypothetical protein